MNNNVLEISNGNAISESMNIVSKIINNCSQTKLSVKEIEKDMLYLKYSFDLTMKKLDNDLKMYEINSHMIEKNMEVVRISILQMLQMINKIKSTDERILEQKTELLKLVLEQQKVLFNMAGKLL